MYVCMYMYMIETGRFGVFALEALRVWEDFSQCAVVLFGVPKGPSWDEAQSCEIVRFHGLRGQSGCLP